MKKTDILKHLESLGKYNSEDIFTFIGLCNSEAYDTIEELTEEFVEWESEIVYCSVCKAKLMHDDEAYNDENTDEVLCDNHSVINEETGNYIKAL